MATRGEIVEKLAHIIRDYRAGEIEPRSPSIIEGWVAQFPRDKQDDLLVALVNVFNNTYLSKDDFKGFLRGLAGINKFSLGIAPVEYWKSVHYLNIQRGGSSQKDILSAFDEVLLELYGYQTVNSSNTRNDFIYLDDCIATGMRVRADLCTWIETLAPPVAKVHVIAPAKYRGSYWIEDKIKEAATANGKNISVQFWRLDRFDLENRRACRSCSDVLWPVSFSADSDVQSYVQSLQISGHGPDTRAAGHSGNCSLFGSDSEKQLIEEMMLVRGCQIRREQTNLSPVARPLGFHNLDCSGFGSMFITYRNCPNNCPLALWVEQSAYPALFPRKTNTHTNIMNIFMN
jgi:hypothetical protein